VTYAVFHSPAGIRVSWASREAAAQTLLTRFRRSKNVCIVRTASSARRDRGRLRVEQDQGRLAVVLIVVSMPLRWVAMLLANADPPVRSRLRR
jgi:hypothetical protein